MPKPVRLYHGSKRAVEISRQPRIASVRRINSFVVSSKYKILSHGWEGTEKCISNRIYNGHLNNNNSIEHQIRWYQACVDKWLTRNCSCYTNSNESRTEKPVATPPSLLSFPFVRTNHPTSSRSSMRLSGPPNSAQPKIPNSLTTSVLTGV